MAERPQDDKETEWADEPQDYGYTRETAWILGRNRIYMWAGCLLSTAIIHACLVAHSKSHDYVRHREIADSFLFLHLLPFIVFLFFWPMPAETPFYKRLLTRAVVALIYAPAAAIMMFVSGFVTKLSVVGHIW